MIKRLIPILALLAFCCIPAHATDCSNNSLGGGWTCVQSKGQASGASGVTTATLAYTSNVTSGNLLVVESSWYNVSNAATVTPTDTLLTSFACLTIQGSTSAPSLWQRICYGRAASSGADTVSFTYSVALVAQYAQQHIFELLGNASSGFYDTSNLGATGSSSSAASGNVMTANAGELLVVCVGTYSVGAPLTAGTDATGGGGTYTLFSLSSGQDSGACELLGNVTAASHNGTMTLNTSTSWIASIAAFVPSGGATPVRRRAIVIQ